MKVHGNARTCPHCRNPIDEIADLAPELNNLVGRRTAEKIERLATVAGAVLVPPYAVLRDGYGRQRHGVCLPSDPGPCDSLRRMRIILTSDYTTGRGAANRPPDRAVRSMGAGYGSRSDRASRSRAASQRSGVS